MAVTLTDPIVAPPKPRPIGVGMPAFQHLHRFADVCEDAFGAPVYLVGSALETKSPRDIDVRILMGDKEFMERIGPVTEFGQPGTKWAALTMAFSALGAQMTGKLIDCQPQFAGIWLAYEAMPRLRLGTKEGEK